MPTNQNDIYIRILADLNDLKTSMREMTATTERAANKQENAWEGVAGKLSKIGLAIQGVQQLIHTLEAGIAPILSFQTSLAEVSTILDVSDGQFSALSGQIENMSLRIPIAADALGKGLYQTISAGVTDTVASLQVLETSSKLAIGGLAESAASVDAVTTVLNSYGLAASQAERVSDLLFNTVREGKTTLTELAPTIGRVTPLAAVLKVSLEELFGSIATLTAGGLKTDQAVTAVASLLRSMTNVSEEGKQLARDLGITWDSTTLKTLGLAGTMRLLRERVGDNAENMRMLIQDSEGLTAALALSGEQFDAFLADVDSMENSAGAMEAAFEKMGSTAENRLQIIRSVFSDLVRDLGEVVIPIIETLARQIGTENSGLVLSLKLLATAVAALATGTALLGLPAQLIAVSKALTAINLALIANPFVAIAAGVTAAATAMLLFTNELRTQKLELLGLGDDAQQVTDNVDGLTQQILQLTDAAAGVEIENVEEQIKFLQERLQILKDTGLSVTVDLNGEEVVLSAQGIEAAIADLQKRLEELRNQESNDAQARAAAQALLNENAAKQSFETHKALLEKRIAFEEAKGGEGYKNAAKLKIQLLQLEEKHSKDLAKIEEDRARDAAQADEIIASRSTESRAAWLEQQLASLEVGTAAYEQYKSELLDIQKRATDKELQVEEDAARTRLQFWVDISQSIGTAIGGMFSDINDGWKSGLKQLLITLLDALRAKMAIVKAFVAAESLVNFLSIPGNLAKLAAVEGLFAAAKVVVTQFQEGSGPITRPTLALIGENVSRSGVEIVVPEKRFIDWAREAMPKMASQGPDTVSHGHLKALRSEIAGLRTQIAGLARATGKETGKAIGSYARGSIG